MKRLLFQWHHQCNPGLKRIRAPPMDSRKVDLGSNAASSGQAKEVNWEKGELDESLKDLDVKNAKQYSRSEQRLKFILLFFRLHLISCSSPRRHLSSPACVLSGHVTLLMTSSRLHTKVIQASASSVRGVRFRPVVSFRLGFRWVL